MVVAVTVAAFGWAAYWQGLLLAPPQLTLDPQKVSPKKVAKKFSIWLCLAHGPKLQNLNTHIWFYLLAGPPPGSRLNLGHTGPSSYQSYIQV